MDDMSRLSYLSRAIHVVADLRVADVTGQELLSAADIAERAGMHAVSLERVLRFPSAYGVFSEVAQGEFRNTSLSESLRQDSPVSIRPNLRRIGEAWWKAVGNLEYSLKIGGSAFTDANGVWFFEYLADNPEQQRHFDAGMAQISVADDAAVAEASDFSKFGKIVDVGGARSGLLVQILSRAADATGVLFDQPQVVEGTTRLEQAGLLDRCELVSGDFFASVLPSGDCYIVKGVLHDFSDERCVSILSNCRAQDSQGGVILVAERILTSSKDGRHPNLTMDVQMLVLLSGRERTNTE